MLVTVTACADPASTTSYSVELPAGVLTKVYVLIPPGHHALAHLRILRGATQIIPWTGTIQGDFETFEWSEHIELPEKEAFVIEVRNDDAQYKHCFYVRFEVQHKLIASPHLAFLSMFKKLIEVLGIE